MHSEHGGMHLKHYCLIFKGKYNCRARKTDNFKIIAVYAKVMTERNSSKSATGIVCEHKVY